MLVTGGLGGLGIIASFHCAAEFENPIITTSRSAKLGSGGPSAMNTYEAMKEIVPVYNVKGDVGNSKEVADLMVWLNRPGVPPEDRSLMIDDICYNLKHKMNTMPDEALRAVQEFMVELKEKLYEVMNDLKNNAVKIDPSIFSELQRKDADVSDLLARLRAKVGNVERSGRVQLVGGLAPGSYTVSDGDQAQLTAGENRKVDKEALLEMMSEEMGDQPQQPPSLEGAAAA